MQIYGTIICSKPSASYFTQKAHKRPCVSPFIAVLKESSEINQLLLIGFMVEKPPAT